MTPFLHPLLIVKASSVHGWGVFTNGDLPQGLVVERSPILTISTTIDKPSPLLYDYRFGWPQGKAWTEFVIGLGYSSFYNHSSSPNTKWWSSEEDRLLIFETLRKVDAGEELFSYYGEDYDWVSATKNH